VIKFRGPQGPWEPMFAWKPVKISGRWHWLTQIYRRERNKYVYPNQGWEYGNTFDVLRDL
jgi:hypothetical protein